MKNLLSTSVRRIDEIRTHMQSIHVIDGKGGYERSLSERSLVAEACFLKLFVALEEFLEVSFAHYLAGRMSTERWRPSKYAKPIDTEHALNMLRGVQPFVDWSNPEKVILYACLYFKEGEPYKTPLSGAISHLKSMKTVRNSSAHLSTTTQRSLEGLYSRWTGNPKLGVIAYDILMATGVNYGKTFYNESEQIVLSIILNIANRK